MEDGRAESDAPWVDAERARQTEHTAHRAAARLTARARDHREALRRAALDAITGLVGHARGEQALAAIARGGNVLVRGGAGIGKSAVLRHLRAELEAAGQTVIWAPATSTKHVLEALCQQLHAAVGFGVPAGVFGGSVAARARSQSAHNLPGLTTDAISAIFPRADSTEPGPQPGRSLSCLTHHLTGSGGIMGLDFLSTRLGLRCRGSPVTHIWARVAPNALYETSGPRTARLRRHQ